MGQKVNPIIFRQAIAKPKVSSWFSKTYTYPHLNHQNIEIQSFLSNLLRSRGLFLRSCIISRSFEKLTLDLDLYFSYMLTKQSKFSWAKNFFKTLKKKYSSLNRIKDLKSFLDNLQETDSYISEQANNNKLKYKFLQETRKKNFLDTNKNLSLLPQDLSLDYKQRFFFLLISKEKKKILLKKKKKMSVLSVVKRASLPKLIRVRFSKLKKLFIVRKLKYSLTELQMRKSFSNFEKFKTNNKTNLLDLNKALCKSLQNFTGIEKIQVRLHSNQLNYIPTLKVYYSFLLKELFVFQRSRDLNKYFFETLETLYFVLGTFSYGNAALLAKTLVYLLENTRKQIYIVRFIKKVLTIFFTKIPSNFLAINGIKVLIKGRFNKRRRTKTLIIQQGQISLQTLKTPIDYYQTQAITLYGSFGIKVWLSKR